MFAMLIPALVSVANAGIPVVGDILIKYLKRYAEKLGNQEPEVVKEINDAIAYSGTDRNARLSQLLHRLREAKRRGAAK